VITQSLVILVKLTQAKQMHWENKAEERSIIIDAFQMLFSNSILILTLVITGQLHQ
jgi:hypothetical protein